jgi:TatD DNase family protein
MEYKDGICESKELCFFDSHAHYYDDRFYGEENPEGAEALLGELFQNGVCGIVNIGTCAKTSALCIEQARRFEKMYAAVGIHPEDIEGSPLGLGGELSALRAMLEKREENKIVALGEIGLDYYWTPFDKALQAECFERQLLMAEEFDIPVVIHDREAHGDCFETILKHPRIKGVFHSYSGSAEMAKELIKRGWYISFSGVVSFKNAAKVKEVALVVPDDRMLIETDAPYLAPHPFRGKLNHSGRLLYTATALADVRGVSVESVAGLTRDNAMRLFNIHK